ncbi:MAG: metallophosphoesterase [Lachnospiraceae bacterium]|nr:metallophosphoesterase [Lachnospiraceae bacterium]
MHYVIGDIHGCYDEMISLVERIRKRDPQAKIIFLGDFCDRGPKVWEVMQWMAQNINPTGNYLSVQGNHDRILQEWFFDWSEWYRSQPLLHRLTGNLDREGEPHPDYDFYEVAKAHHALTPRRLNSIFATYTLMPFHYEITVPGRNGAPVVYDIVHGWFEYNMPENAYGQHMYNTWARELNGNYANDHIIVHGHTPTVTEPVLHGHPETPPGMIAYRHNAINLDGGCCYYKPGGEYPCLLCAICLESMVVFFSHRLEVRLGREMAAAYREKYLSEPNPFRLEMLRMLGHI